MNTWRILIWQWARLPELKRFNVPISHPDPDLYNQLTAIGWQAEQLTRYFREGWYVCACQVIRERPPEYTIENAWGYVAQK